MAQTVERVHSRNEVSLNPSTTSPHKKLETKRIMERKTIVMGGKGQRMGEKHTRCKKDKVPENAAKCL
jgi:hypothetical protein